MQLQLDSRYNAVVSFIGEASDGSVPQEVQAHLYRFGTVLICGYIERAMEIIIMERLSYRAQPRVLNFIRSHFKRGRNMDPKGVGELLKRFDVAWYREFDRLAQADAGMSAGVYSCYDIRNTVAHGGTATVTLRRLNQLLAAAKQLVDYVVQATR
jgi:hypothetical protein